MFKVKKGIVRDKSFRQLEVLLYYFVLSKQGYYDKTLLEISCRGSLCRLIIMLILPKLVLTHFYLLQKVLFNIVYVFNKKKIQCS